MIIKCLECEKNFDTDCLEVQAVEIDKETKHLCIDCFQEVENDYTVCYDCGHYVHNENFTNELEDICDWCAEHEDYKEESYNGLTDYERSM
jgi:5-methylcytosine-specific restriction endonuclease McrA